MDLWVDTGRHIKYTLVAWKQFSGKEPRRLG